MGIKYKIYVTTGDKKFAGTDADISVTLRDTGNRSSGPHKLDVWYRDEFERGRTDEFTLGGVPELGELNEIEIFFDEKGFGSDWYCEKIRIEKRAGGSKTEYIFPVHRWLRNSKSLKLMPFDSQLPQNSKHQKQRKAELEEKRKVYQLVEVYKGLPIQVKQLPEEESFTDEIKWDLMKRKCSYITQKVWNSLWEKGDHFTSIDEVVAYFEKYPSLGAPHSVNTWKDDFYFGQQRLNGCNPKLIRLCTEIPKNFQVEEKFIKEFLETRCLHLALKERRVFIVDLKILEGIKTMEGTTVCAPLALFYLTDSNQLRPIAIQLFQSEGPVFYPSDDANLWLLVKMWYNNADASYHQSCVHLQGTHLVMEGICVSTNRQLSPSHPIYRLLAPHFLFILAINTRGLQKLISPGGWVDSVMAVGVDGMMQLMAKRHGEIKFETELDFKEDLRMRGVLDADILPDYYYRKDGLRVHEAISNYVDRMVHLFYPTEEDMVGDYELQNWAKELVAPTAGLQGLGLRDVPGNGQFHRYEDLKRFLSVVIFVCSCEHAAVNFSQYDNYAFPPNYPPLLRGTPPTDKTPRSEQDIVASLPTIAQTTDTMIITKILSERGTKKLGDFEMQYHYHSDALKIVETFRRELEEIGQRIRAELPNRSYQYSVLDPETVPNSISI